MFPPRFLLLLSGTLLVLCSSLTRQQCVVCPTEASWHDDCPCQEDDTPHQSPLVCVEDRALMLRLMQDGQRLIDEGQVVSVRELLQPAGPRQCWLEVPKSAPVETTRPELYQRAKQSVVVVAGFYKCKKCTRWHATTASGFAITADGAVVTNYHVVRSESKHTILVMTADQRVFPVEKILAIDDRNDLAVLQIEANDLTPLPIADLRESAPIGTPVSVISHPASHYYYFSTGVVSRHMRMMTSDRTLDAIAITADYARGSSGAPVLNDQGQVIAIARSTESIYYRVQEGQQENLQMVFKDCVPSHCLLALIEAPAPVPVDPASTGFDDAGPEGETAAESAQAYPLAAFHLR